MASDTKEVEADLSPIIKVYKDGTVERIYSPAYVPASLDPVTGVSSKDITISSEVLARIYLPPPKIMDPPSNNKLPILVYFHSGGFCLDSAFGLAHHCYLNQLVSKANAVTISVEYRLAPEHPLPAAFEDSWTALQWLASHADGDSGVENKDPWLINYGDFDKVYLGGDSAGANIVHNMAIRAGVEGCLSIGVKILGAFLCFPYFLDPETRNKEDFLYRLWMLVDPSAPNGVNSSLMNPFGEDAPSLSGIVCQKLLVCCAEKDELRGIALRYVEELKNSDWKGEVELVDVDGADHCFQVFQPESEKAQILISCLASFLKGL